MSASRSRLQRLFGGWSANLFQILLGVTQQLIQVPLFLRYGSSEMLAAWLALYAAGNLVVVGDSGLQLRVINRFLSFKSCVDEDGRTAQYFVAMQHLYAGLTILLVIGILTGTYLLPPSFVFGFRGTTDFDASFAVMTSGMLLVLPSNLASGLYRAQGLYGRAVWIQSAAMLVSQLAQVVAIVATRDLVIITIAFVVPQIMAAAYLAMVDVWQLFPTLSRARSIPRPSRRWFVGQLRRAFPFAIAGTTEIALQNLPVLLVSAIVTDRVAVAQWGLTRLAAGLVRALCMQATIPIAAELGYDRAVNDKEALRHLYARGSALVTFLASLAVSGLLAFWQIFFIFWTHDTIPYDIILTLTLLVGAQLAAPAALALSYGYYSDRGELLARAKLLQLAAFVALSLLLTPLMGPLGAALAVVATDLIVQFGLVATVIMRATLERPARHVVFLLALMVVVTALGWGLGETITFVLPRDGFVRFIIACTLWLVIVAAAASPLASKSMRAKLARLVPA
jgi:O-antigen/teichoic acid export membrane protein